MSGERNAFAIDAVERQQIVHDTHAPPGPHSERAPVVIWISLLRKSHLVLCVGIKLRTHVLAEDILLAHQLLENQAMRPEARFVLVDRRERPGPRGHQPDPLHRGPLQILGWAGREQPESLDRQLRMRSPGCPESVASPVSLSRPPLATPDQPVPRAYRARRDACPPWRTGGSRL